MSTRAAPPLVRTARGTVPAITARFSTRWQSTSRAANPTWKRAPPTARPSPPSADATLRVSGAFVKSRVSPANQIAPPSALPPFARFSLTSVSLIRTTTCCPTCRAPPAASPPLLVAPFRPTSQPRMSIVDGAAAA